MRGRRPRADTPPDSQICFRGCRRSVPFGLDSHLRPLFLCARCWAIFYSRASDLSKTLSASASPGPLFLPDQTRSKHGILRPSSLVARKPCPIVVSRRRSSMLLIVPLAAGFVGSRPSPLVARGGCPADCHGNGVCINGVCRCDASWRGDDCGTSACPALCHGRGRCDFGSCVCEAGFTGIACESGASDGCPEHCSGHGWCIERSAIRVERAGVSSRSQCSCRPGWRGAACDVDTCPSHCSGHGTCVSGNCSCTEG